MKDGITLTALDGHSFEVYLATPAGKPKAAVVVFQEIFGLNAHIKGLLTGLRRLDILSLRPRCLTGLRRILRLPMTMMVLPKVAV